MSDWLGAVGDLSTAFVSVLLAGLLVLDTVPLIGMLVPADVAVLAAVATRGPLGALAVIVAVVAGTLLGWTFSFVLGRFLAGPMRRSWLGRRIGEARWAGAERLVAGGGGRMVLAAPFLPVFNTIVPIAAGSLRMPYRHFLGYATVGSALWAGGYVGLGLAAERIGGAVFGGANEVLTTLLFGLPGLALGWVTLARVKRRMAAGGPADTSADDATSTGAVTAAAGAVTITAGAVAAAGMVAGSAVHPGRRRLVAIPASTSQASATTSAARSSSPVVYPRPRTSMPSPVAASSGTATHPPARLIRRRRSAVSGAMASSTMAAAASSTASTLAVACTRSAGRAASYGGSGQPGVQVTAPDTAAIGAAAKSASVAARIGAPFARLLTCPRRRAAASSANATATAKMPSRYTPMRGAPGAPASLTYPYPPAAVALTDTASAAVPVSANPAATGPASNRAAHARLPRDKIIRWTRSSGRRPYSSGGRRASDARPWARRA
jgi:membrane protein DedA with SNARE-associated domain